MAVMLGGRIPFVRIDGPSRPLAGAGAPQVVQLQHELHLCHSDARQP